MSAVPDTTSPAAAISAAAETLAEIDSSPDAGGSELSAAVGSGSPRKRSRDHTGREPSSTGRLGVRPARLVRRNGEQAEQLHGALRVLYRDYLAERRT